MSAPNPWAHMPHGLPPDSEDPRVYKTAPNGHITRYREFSCVGCILSKKGCEGPANDCLRCRGKKECSHDPAEYAAACATLKVKRSNNADDASGPATSVRAPSGAKRGRKRRASFDEDDSSDASTSGDQDEIMRDYSDDENAIMASSAQDDSANTNQAATTNDVQYLFSRYVPNPTKDMADMYAPEDNVTIGVEAEDDEKRRELDIRMAVAQNIIDEKEQKRINRVNQQKRSVKAMSPEEINAIPDGVVRRFILNHYQSLFSRTLKPILLEMVKEIRDDYKGEGEISNKKVTKELHRRWNLAWGLFLEYYEDAWGKVARWTAKANMTAKEKVEWLKPQFQKPRTEGEAEEFFFAYVCCMMHGWDTDPEMFLAKWCYVQCVDEHYPQLKLDLQQQGELGEWAIVDRTCWLMEWLHEKMKQDNRIESPGDSDDEEEEELTEEQLAAMCDYNAEYDWDAAHAEGRFQPITVDESEEDDEGQDDDALADEMIESIKAIKAQIAGMGIDPLTGEDNGAGYSITEEDMEDIYRCLEENE